MMQRSLYVGQRIQLLTRYAFCRDAARAALTQSQQITRRVHLHRVSVVPEITALVEVTINHRPPAVPASGPIHTGLHH